VSLETRAGLLATVEARLDAEPADPDDEGVWGTLAGLIDPAEARPKLADDIEVKRFDLRWGNDYVMIANPRDLLHYQLTPQEADLMGLMDGTRTLNEIVVDRFRASGELELSGVADLVRELYQGNFLDRRFLDVNAALGRALEPPTPGRRAANFFKTLRVDWNGADRLVRGFYHVGLRWFFTRIGLIVASGVSLLGFLAFLSIALAHQIRLTGGNLALGFVLLLGLNYFLTFIHEMGHAVSLTHHGRRVKSAGFMIYFGSPAFFVESSDGLMLDRWARIKGAFAGAFAESIVSGVAAILAWSFPGAALSRTLYTFAALNYLILVMNLIPLLELDGYFILADLIEVPDLRPRSLAFTRHELWGKLRHRERFTKQEVGLGLYGVLGVVFTIFSFYTAFYFWRTVFGGFIGEMWNGGTVTRILLILLALAIVGPIVRGAISLVRTIYRRSRAIARRIRFRIERSWRVEAAELIDALPLFDDVPEDVLGELAGRVRLRTFPRGQPVIRQGERAVAFYVIRRGTFRVVEEDPETGEERALRVLGRGESFGELGLAEGRARAATVRALEEAEAFEVDKAAFDHLLADMVHVPHFAPTLQATAELRSIRCFALLEPDELAEVLRAGEWRRIAPGETVIEEGEAGDAFYAVGSGQFDVLEGGERIATLGPGDFFGEVALLLDVPRTATIVARTPARVYRLDRDGFDRLVAGAFQRGTLNPHISPDRTLRH
jgi:CRP-like cAMP-binding protein/Zn-dependent protease